MKKFTTPLLIIFVLLTILSLFYAKIKASEAQLNAEKANQIQLEAEANAEEAMRQAALATEAAAMATKMAAEAENYKVQLAECQK